jgi:argininosuccinate lyase
VLYCIEKGKAIDDLDINELEDICPMFDDDIYEAVSLQTCVERRLTDGAPGEQAMLTAVKRYKEYLDR